MKEEWPWNCKKHEGNEGYVVDSIGIAERENEEKIVAVDTDYFCGQSL